MYNQEERRRFVRLNLMADVVYSKVYDSKEAKLSISKNISKGGICFITYEELLPAEILNLEIYLPENSIPIRVKGKVVWSKKFCIVSDRDHWGDRFDVGVEFIDINKEDMEKIEQASFRLKS